MAPPRWRRSLSARILNQVRPQLRYVFVLLGLDLLAAPLVLVSPLPLRIAVDSVIGTEPLPDALAALLPPLSRQGTLLLAALLLVAVALLSQLQSMAASVQRALVGEKLTLAFRSRLFRHAQRLSLVFHDARGVADPTYRIQKDTQSLRYLLIDGLLPAIGAGTTLVSMLYVTYRIDYELATIAVLVTPVLLVLASKYRRALKRQSREVKNLESGALGVLHEVLSTLRVVKAFGAEDREQERFERAYDGGARARVRMAWTAGNLGLLLGLTTAGGTAAVLFVGVRNVLAGSLTLGELLLVMGYVAQLYAPLRTMSRKAASIQTHVTGAERAFDLLDERPDIEERPGARPVERARGEFVLEDVRFAYEGGPPVLDGLSACFRPGSRTGVAGETGAGKSTLISLLMRFQDPTGGRILLDGSDLRDLRLQDLRAQFAIVPQDTILFSTTIEENIAYSRPGARHEEIVAAARAANAHRFIESLPEGYATLVGERGMRLSGGERQRVALARAFLKDAPILVLDEPTSALDPGTEGEVLEALQRLMQHRTTILIAHRESTLEACDEVLTLRDGRFHRRAEVLS